MPNTEALNTGAKDLGKETFVFPVRNAMISVLLSKE